MHAVVEEENQDHDLLGLHISKKSEEEYKRGSLGKYGNRSCLDLRK